MSWRKVLPAAAAMCRSVGAELHILPVVPDLPAGVLELYLPKGRAADLVRKVDSGLAKFAKQQLKTRRHIGTWARELSTGLFWKPPRRLAPISSLWDPTARP
jgi:hypothetical protein